MDISAKHKKAPITQIKNLLGVLDISRVVEDRNKWPGFIRVVFARGNSVKIKVIKNP